ncbi:MAG: lipase [Chloroflexota bacterium]|nr:lipase [Chloroflexota bacterium]
MAKVVAIGDSLTQGFQSGAIFQTEWSYAAMIARSMNLQIPIEFRIPRFPGTGLPLNIEALLRWMSTSLGPDITRDEWFLHFPLLLNRFMDDVEDLYERGTGSQPAAFGGVYHNLAVWGFRVADSYTVTSKYAALQINAEEGFIADDFLGLPSAPMYRTARRILNPRLRPEREEWTMLDNLKQIVQEEPVENLIIWLGSNDALGTVLNLEFKPMGTTNVPSDPHQRRRWNLTHPDVFKHDFTTLVKNVKAILRPETKVFVGTIGHVIIPPVTQGIPPFDGTYFAYYGRFFANQSNFNPYFHKNLTREHAMHIDATIDQFNATIRQIVGAQGAQWHVVDLGAILDELAVKRNNLEDAPDRPLRNYYAKLGITDHPLLRLSPVPSVLRLRTREHGERYTGGLFSLDCFHPSTIGYGIVAEAFLRAMQRVGVPDADPMRLNWQDIVAHDTLLQNPPLLWDDITEAAEHNATLWDVIFRVLG